MTTACSTTCVAPARTPTTGTCCTSTSTATTWDRSASTSSGAGTGASSRAPRSRRWPATRRARPRRSWPCSGSPRPSSPRGGRRRRAARGASTTRLPPAPRPRSLDDLRAAGPTVGAALDAYLAEFGWRTVTGDDLDARTVGELPEALVANVLAATEPFDAAAAARAGDQAADALRAEVPE